MVADTKGKLLKQILFKDALLEDSCHVYGEGEPADWSPGTSTTKLSTLSSHPSLEQITISAA